MTLHKCIEYILLVAGCGSAAHLGFNDAAVQTVLVLVVQEAEG